MINIIPVTRINTVLPITVSKAKAWVPAKWSSHRLNGVTSRMISAKTGRTTGVISKNRQDAANAPDSVESGLPSSVEGLPDNPSDEALFVRQGATYLEESDKPSESYDPHHMGYGNGDDEKKDKS
jgi:hypothetical protein